MPFKKGETPAGARVFEPGVSGNLKGRPKGLISQLLLEYGTTDELLLTIEKTDAQAKTSHYQSALLTGPHTLNMTIAVRLLQMALNGDIQAIREVLNRTEGRVGLPVANKGNASAGAELKVWTAEEVDQYDAWRARHTAASVSEL